LACRPYSWSTPKGTGIIRLASMMGFLGMLLWSMSLPTFAQDAPGVHRKPDGTLTFDIGPQSLRTALRAYGEVTGQAVLVDDALTAERQSPGVQGDFGKVDALQRLLAGTGLVASYSTDQAFTLKLATRVESSESDSGESSQSSAVGGLEVVTQNYAGTIQRSIESALCRFDQTRPGTYRLALQVWIAPSGKIEQTRVLSVDDDARAAAVSKALNQVVLDPPPVAMPQPLTLLLLPRNPADVARCDALVQRHH
jgi:hypothetical protein